MSVATESPPTGAARSWLPARLALSRAKHPSVTGHAKLSRVLARWLPYFEYGPDDVLCSDGCPEEIRHMRAEAFERLSTRLTEKRPRSLEMTARLAGGLSDLQFIDAYRIPYPYRAQLAQKLRVGALYEASEGVRVRDLDGNWSYDLTGSYGVNVFGLDFYKECIDRAARRAGELGPLLGPYHPVILDNVERLQALSGHDEVSFHMSGTEAVMQATACARYHTGRKRLVRFCGAYHGWWDGVQPGVGNPRKVHDVYTLSEMSEDTLHVLDSRRDIACVLVNPLQALSPNAAAAGDATLLNSKRSAAYDKAAYTRWLRRLREICTRRGIVLILDEVFLGFRVARGGVQEYFGIEADMVTYGKTLGGGLPIGVVCGPNEIMKRYRPERPSDIHFARGTFNGHPYVMAAMNEFLQKLDDPEIQAAYEGMDERWDGRRAELNERLRSAGLPVEFANMTSVWTTLYKRPSRYNWLFQFYLRAEGLALSWVGSGRFIFSHAYDDARFDEVARRIVSAAEKMDADGWWWTDGRLDNGRINRQVLRRSLRALVRGR